VAGCDGAHSTVRRQAGVPFEGHGYGDDWLLADVALDWDRPPDDVHIFFHPGGRAAVCMPMRGGRWRVILYFAGRRDHAGEPSLAEVAELVAERIAGRVAVSDPTWLASFRTHRRSAPAYRRGRVLLAGDAVHIHSPAGGQGMNTGLLDAQNLGWKLAAVAAGRAPEGLLDSYQAERAPVARDVLALSHRLVRLSALSAPWQRAARAAVLPLAARVPGLRGRMARRVSQLYVSYRRSPLTAGEGPRGQRVRPGDRAPDAGGLCFRGHTVRLHELLFREPGHALLVLDGGAGDRLATLPDVYGRPVRVVAIAVSGEDAGLGAAVDVSGEVRRAYGSGGVYLVRPDGYVAASGWDAVSNKAPRPKVCEGSWKVP